MADRGKLTAQKGMVLFNGRTWGVEVYPGCQDDAEKWEQVQQDSMDKPLLEPVPALEL